MESEVGGMCTTGRVKRERIVASEKKGNKEKCEVWKGACSSRPASIHNSLHIVLGAARSKCITEPAGPRREEGGGGGGGGELPFLSWEKLESLSTGNVGNLLLNVVHIPEQRDLNETVEVLATFQLHRARWTTRAPLYRG